MSEFTAEEASAILELKKRVQPWAAEVGNKFALDYLEEDGVMWRYAAAHKLDLDKAEEQFKVSTSWKLENELDGMYENFIGSDGLSYSDGSAFGGTSREAKLGAKVYYGGILAAKTVNGGPIMVERMGKVDISGLAKNEEAKNACLKAYIVTLERMFRLLRQEKDKTKCLTIIDCEGIGFSMIRHMNLLREVIRQAVPNFPELAEKVIIVRAPAVATTLWTLLKPLLPERTKKKVTLLGKNYIDELASFVDGGADALPEFLGGNASNESVCEALPVSDALSSLE